MAEARTPMDRLRGTEINPILLAPVVLVVLLALLYFLWLGPKMKADAALRDFNTPEAQAKRDPDQRKQTPEQRRKIDELLAKEQHYSPGVSRRRQRE